MTSDRTSGPNCSHAVVKSQLLVAMSKSLHCECSTLKVSYCLLIEKFNLASQIVTTFIYKPSLVRIDPCSFELSYRYLELAYVSFLIQAYRFRMLTQKSLKIVEFGGKIQDLESP